MRGKCELCGCEDDLTVHHLIPQQVSRHKNKYLKTDEGNFIFICKECHSQIHALYTNQELKELYSTKERLLEAEKLKKYIDWKKKHPNFRGSSKMSNSQKARRGI